jgi:hypothetical protein
MTSGSTFRLAYAELLLTPRDQTPADVPISLPMAP